MEVPTGPDSPDIGRESPTRSLNNTGRFADNPLVDPYPFMVAKATLLFLVAVLTVEYAIRRLICFRKLFIWALALCLLTSCGGRGALRPTPPALDVIQCRLAANQEYVGVRFRVIGVEKFDPETMDAYLIDESTGEKFPVVRLQRIGRLAEFTAQGEKDVRHIMFRNREGKLKVGTRVTVVIGSARKGDLTLQ